MRSLELNRLKKVGLRSLPVSSSMFCARRTLLLEGEHTGCNNAEYANKHREFDPIQPIFGSETGLRVFREGRRATCPSVHDSASSPDLTTALAERRRRWLGVGANPFAAHKYSSPSVARMLVHIIIALDGHSTGQLL
jgi:hypothetical protein